MENHPIPQDVTGFQFKLIGEMTIKQFAYLATGVVLSSVFFFSPLPILLKIPFILVFCTLGIGFAFFPVSGRPMDTMLLNFIKALFRPTQFFYHKQGGTLFAPVDASQAQTPITQPQAPAAKNEPEISVVNTQAAPLPDLTSASPHIISSSFPSLEEEAPKEDKEVKETKPEEKPQGETTPLKETPSLDPLRRELTTMEKDLQTAMAQKGQLTQDILSLKKAFDVQKATTFTASVASQPPQPNGPKPQTQNVKQIPKGMEKKFGLPLTPDSPNLVGGIIKDPRGNPLPNILVEIKDQEGNPVRAFKTNGLGQFISATPLLNGTYTVDFEDPNSKNKFDAIQFSAAGSPILPIEVTSVDQREELRQELFGPRQ